MTDRHLQEHVQRALDWDPSIDAAAIGVSVDDGVVTLRGEVPSYVERCDAERVALGVFGVKAVANELTITLNGPHRRTDSEIAQAAVNALAWNASVPQGRITVSVTDGWITLRGDVDWDYQRTSAVHAIRSLTGVRGVTNAMTVKPRVSVGDVRSRIEDALKRSAQVDARRINVNVTDGTVILSGHVRSWAEDREARLAPGRPPG